MFGKSTVTTDDTALHGYRPPKGGGRGECNMCADPHPLLAQILSSAFFLVILCQKKKEREKKKKRFYAVDVCIHLNVRFTETISGISFKE